MLNKRCSYGLIRLANSEIPFLSLKGVVLFMRDALNKVLHRTSSSPRSIAVGELGH